MATVSELMGSRELMVNLTLRELRGKYKRSVLGWTWSLVNPLATMVTFAIVFRLFLKVPVEVGRPSGLQIFAFFLLCGLLPWNYLSNGLTGAMSSLIANANLIKKVYFPREILVFSNVAAWLVSSLVEFGVLVVALVFVGNIAVPWLPAVLVLLVLQTLLIVGLGLMLSVLNAYFRDVQHFLGIVLQLWFYATPIVYPHSIVPARADVLGLDVPVRAIYDLNPMVKLVDGYRDALYHLKMPAFDDMAYVAVMGACLVAFGLFVFARLEPRLAEEL